MTDDLAAWTDLSWFQRNLSILAINSHFSGLLGAVHVVGKKLVLLNT
jgi:hypothetical protein